MIPFVGLLMQWFQIRHVALPEPPLLEALLSRKMVAVAKGRARDGLVWKSYWLD